MASAAGAELSNDDHSASSFNPIQAPPTFVSAEEHAHITSSTPASFQDIPPVLRFHSEEVEVELDPKWDGLVVEEDHEAANTTASGRGRRGGKKSKVNGNAVANAGAAVQGRVKGKVWVTEASESSGFSLVYPRIVLFAVPEVAENEEKYLYCQVDDPSLKVQDEEDSQGQAEADDEERPTRDMKIFVKDSETLGKLYQAMSDCAALHPSLPDSDDEEPSLPIIRGEGDEPSFEIDMNGFEAIAEETEDQAHEVIGDDEEVKDREETLVDRLMTIFPLTQPIPTPLTHPELIHPSSIPMEEDLLSTSDNIRAWLTYINATRDRINKSNAAARASSDAPTSPEDALLGPLANPDARKALQELTMIFERAVAIFPTTYKLWKLYMQMRQSYVLGPLTADAIKAQKNNEKRGPKVKTEVTEMLAFAESEWQWEGGLDGVVGFAEWKSLIATGERMIRCLPHLPAVWLTHLSALLHRKCPAVFQRTYARRTFDRALRSLPPSLHARIWGPYLRWAEERGGAVGDRVWRRLLKVDPSLTERHITHLLNSEPPRPLPAAKYLLSLARKAAKGTYMPLEGKSPYQLFVDWLELVENFAEEVGLDADDTAAEYEAIQAQIQQNEDSQQQQDEQREVAAVSMQGKLMRFEGAPVSLEEYKAQQKQKPTENKKDNAKIPEIEKYDEATDAASPKQLNVEEIVIKDGLGVYKDQAGRLWTGLATYWIKRGEFDKAVETFERGINGVVTVRDFTQIFDAYAEFSETLMTSLMTAVSNPDEEDEEDLEETEAELDKRMKDFEELMDRRPFLVNDVLLRRNPNEVVEWEKRIALHGDDDEKVAETYSRALEAIQPKKAIGPLYPLYINYAKFYETGGAHSEPDLDAARKIFEKATRVHFKTVDELAEVWCEWAEMELRHENFEEAIRIMQRATTLPRNVKVSFHDESLSPQARLFKSLKLWSFYVDLEESIGSVESTKAVYDKIMELKIANAQVTVNYAQFLEDNKYFEESFKVYERGIELFNFPIAFELWNIYLSKFVARYRGTKLERTRDLFEQALEKCPEKFCKPLFLLYAQLEEEHGLAKRAMGIYERAAESVQDKDKFEMFTIYIAKATENFGLPATRPIYQKAIEVLPDRQAAEMCLRFSALERKLGEIDRARAIYAYASQFCDPRTYPEFWSEWNSFEIDTGSEDTFREMLRIKRSVQAAFNTEASYIAAQTAAAQKGAEVSRALEDASLRTASDAADPMAALERGGAPSFVPSSSSSRNQAPADDSGNGAAVVNPDAIDMDDLDDDDDEE